ncbi:hypothetical protein L1987_24397 [Smallanthus sonchifolius]|uniref:Uncharacterized protein n=1 Tax=Smallanthus sonchifolius TaxID=185202 RepID=A0ACB9IKX7_9ASTR|nr:hypothetical protein L1987_24397 [Smallanthus sonchifolius]
MKWAGLDKARWPKSVAIGPQASATKRFDPVSYICRLSSKPSFLRLVAAAKKSISPTAIYHQIVQIHRCKCPFC